MAAFDLLAQGLNASLDGEDALNTWYSALTEQQQSQLDSEGRTWLDTVKPLRTRILLDCRAAGMSPEEAGEYCRTILTYLGLAFTNFTQRSTSLVTWENQHEKPRYTFARQALAMAWDYTEVNPFGPLGILRAVEQMALAIERLPANEPINKGE